MTFSPPKPKLTITSNTKVTDLLKYYSQNLLTLNELSHLFNTVVRWDSRPLDAPVDWQGINTWKSVYAAAQARTLAMEDYMFLSQQYENHMNQKG